MECTFSVPLPLALTAANFTGVYRWAQGHGGRGGTGARGRGGGGAQGYGEGARMHASS
jgi:hypothetical protein